MSTADGDGRLLELDAVQAYYGLAHVLQGVSLEVRRGEVTALLGRNGAGKTTTLRSVMGLVAVRGGTIRFDGTPLTGRPTHRIARMGIGYVPEDRRMFPGLTVEENLRLAALGQGLDRERTRSGFERVWELFPALREHARREAARLSGGQQQMVAIARALIGAPRLLLIDEPTQGLAPAIARDIARTLAGIAGTGVGVLLVEQNAVMALEVARRAYVLDEGRIVAQGPAARIRDDAEIRSRYLAV
ncbi:MAG TPA: ABC transporter ATP-binding protein [Candidatus Dormibacteraeota bacterium]|nr:ABC transporter ATP-binding protein [Candidatus Dormibacteraeota bacterium]